MSEAADTANNIRCLKYGGGALLSLAESLAVDKSVHPPYHRSSILRHLHPHEALRLGRQRHKVLDGHHGAVALVHLG